MLQRTNCGAVKGGFFQISTLRWAESRRNLVAI
jgi:hypothetical protein